MRLKKEKPLQPGHCLLQDLVLRRPSFGAGGLLFCIKSISTPDSSLGTGISSFQPLVGIHHLKRRRQKLIFISDWPLDAWRITIFSTRAELTRRRREEVGHGLSHINRRRKLLYLYASSSDGRNTFPCWNVSRWSRAPGITISQRGIPWIVRSRATILVRPCAALGELKVARIHDIRFILCLGCCVCVGAGKGATSDKLQLTVDASTRERMPACLSLILIRI